jgi:hypothetical protein
MKNFNTAVKEVKGTLTKLMLFELILNAVIVFLALFLVSSIFGLAFYFAAAAAALYLTITFRNRLRTNKIRMVEKKYTRLNEKLRTAAEFSTTENKVVDELHTEVLYDLRKVQESAFISEKKLYGKTGAIVALCFLIILLSPITLGILDFSFSLPQSGPPDPDLDISDGTGASSNVKLAFGNEGEGLVKVSDSIYGEPSMAQLGNQEVNVRIKPAGSEMNLRTIQEAEEREFGESYPVDVQAVSAGSYEEDIPKEDLELVRDYFNNLAQS